MRRLSQRAMATEMKAAVARLTGRRVVACSPTTTSTPTWRSQVFILEPAPG